MVPNIKKTSELVQEITAASEEQSSGVGQINSAVSHLSMTTQQNASSSEELAATAEELSSQAEQLQQTMSFFKLSGNSSHKKSNGARALPRQVKPVTPKRVANEATFGGAAFAADAVDESEFVKF